MTIKQIQCLLEYLNFSPGAIDGQFGEQTRNAVKRFQSTYAIEPDGIPGAMTEKMLLGVIAGTVALKTSDKPAETSDKPTAYNSSADQYLKSDGYYHITKGKAVKLSQHFVSTEFDCQGRGCCKETIINPKLVKHLEDMRVHFDRPITLTSAYRCESHNGAVGGATGSRHIRGDASDIVVSQHTPRTVARYAEDIGILGIGLYETNADGHFVHIDTRPAKSYWYGQAQQYRSTFK